MLFRRQTMPAPKALKGADRQSGPISRGGICRDSRAQTKRPNKKRRRRGSATPLGGYGGYLPGREDAQNVSSKG